MIVKKYFINFKEKGGKIILKQRGYCDEKNPNKIINRDIEMDIKSMIKSMEKLTNG